MSGKKNPKTNKNNKLNSDFSLNFRSRDLVHRSEQGPPPQAKSYFLGSGGGLRDGGGGGGDGGGRGVSASGGAGEGRLLHGGLAGQKLLEDGVHLAADHLLDGERANRSTFTAGKLHRQVKAKFCSATDH